MYPNRREPAFGLFVQKQVEALRGAGVQVDVLAMPRRGSGWRGRLAYGLWALRGLGRLARRYDAVHAHYAVPSGVLGLWYRRLRGRPLVVTVHGSDVLVLPERFPRLAPLLRRVLTGADHVIAVSNFLRQRVMERFGVPPGRITVQSAGIDTRVFRPEAPGAAEVRARYGQQPLVVFTGNLIRRKGVDVLIQAFARVRERLGSGHLLLVGPPVEEDYHEILRERVAALHLEEHVTFAGPLPPAEVAAAMAAADVFVLPSLDEGLGLVVLEALACGVPVVASRVGGIPEIVQDGDFGLLVPPGDVNALAGAIRRVLEDASFRERARQYGPRVAAAHDLRRRAAELVVLYRSLQQGKGRRRRRGAG
ncbi:MAG: glycosyltransferase family 4 protein [Bacillota bacterium]|nr:MAG: glycosyltransferase family 4 protein [Bacillota bacterium]